LETRRFKVNQTEKSKANEVKKKITAFAKWLSGETKVTTSIVRGDPFGVAGRLK